MSNCYYVMLHCALASCGTVYCNRSCLWVCVFAMGGRAGGVRTLLQPARAQCLRLCERFFHLCIELESKAYLYLTTVTEDKHIECIFRPK